MGLRDIVCKLFRGVCLFTLVMGAAIPVRAQFATVSGRVTEGSSGSPIEGANIVLLGEEGRSVGTASERDGRFTLGGVRPGSYVLQATFVGYEPFTDTLEIAFSQTHVQQITLRRIATATQEVVVESDREGTANQQAGLVTVAPSALSRVPMPGITPDLAGYLLTLPGVVSAGDRGGQLFIRGGTPAENLVLIDGMPMYQPFHIVGFYSAFPADIIAYADVYAGGFGARYGGRLSSVIDVVTRNGSKDRVRGAVSLAPFLSALRVEGPIARDKVSFLGTARASVLEHIAPGLAGNALDARFGDFFGKFHAFLNQTSTFTATAIHTYDHGRIDPDEASGRISRWRNTAYGGRYNYLPADFPVLAELAVFLTRLESSDAAVGRPDRSATITGSHGEINFTYLLGEHQVRFGMFGRFNGFDYTLDDREGRLEEGVTEGGGYIEARVEPVRHLQVESGLRFHTFANGIGSAIEPRLRARWQAGGTTFSAAWGTHHQQVIGLTNQRDVGDVFVAWQTIPRNSAVPSAVHTILGISRRLTPWLDASAEVYTRQLRNQFYADYDENGGRFQTLGGLRGAASGLDVRLEHTGPSLYAYLGYGLARVRFDATNATADFSGRQEGGSPTEQLPTGRFHPPHDRRHQVQALVQVRRGGWQASARWQLGSGRPFTRIYGFYHRIPTGTPDESYHTHPGTPTIAFAQAYGGRLPLYHRLDVSVEHLFRAGGADISLQLGAINTYNRANLFDYDLFTLRRIDQLPFIPTAGLKIEIL